MAGLPVDFATVQWARKRSNDLEPLLTLPADDIQKLAVFLEKLAVLKSVDAIPSPAQMAILLQNLHTKQLDSLEAVKGGLMVQFSGGGYKFERFLLKEDGRVPNNKYQNEKAS